MHVEESIVDWIESFGYFIHRLRCIWCWTESYYKWNFEVFQPYLVFTDVCYKISIIFHIEDTIVNVQVNL